MKRVFSLLAAAALCAGLALPVYAADPAVTPAPAPTAEPAADPAQEPAAAPTAEPTAAPTQQPTPEPAAAYEADPATPAVPLASNAYIISASAVSVADGELTAIKKGDVFNVVVVVADLASDGGALIDNLKNIGNDNGKVAEDYISARITSAAFSHTGTAEVSPYKPAAEGTTTEAYYENFLDQGYYKYKLVFRNVVWQGGDNTFNFDVSYPESMMAYKSLSFTIGQCATSDTDGDGTPDGDENRTPHLMVRSSSYGNDLINAGTPFTLAVTVYATKGNEDLEDVTVTLDLRSEGVSLQSGTLSQYIGTMRANSTQQVYFTILPSVSFTGGVADIGVSLQGFGAKTGAEASGNVAISVPIEQPDRFEVTGMEVSDTFYIGEGGSITVNFVNKGRNPISNLEATISGQNLGADMPQQYLGNLAAGTESSVDFDLNPSEEGPVVGTVVLTYEAADGSAKSITQEFSATAVMMVYEDPGMMGGEDIFVEPEPEHTGLPVWGWVAIGAAVLGAVIAIVVLVRKRRKAKALATLEADDEDF